MIFFGSLPFYFRLNEHPSVNLALPPVGWHSTVEQPPQITTVWACEKTVVMVKQPGHFTSMKKERGAGTRVWRLEVLVCALREERMGEWENGRIGAVGVY